MCSLCFMVLGKHCWPRLDCKVRVLLYLRHVLFPDNSLFPTWLWISKCVFLNCFFVFLNRSYWQSVYWDHLRAASDPMSLLAMSLFSRNSLLVYCYFSTRIGMHDSIAVSKSEICCSYKVGFSHWCWGNYCSGVRTFHGRWGGKKK